MKWNFCSDLISCLHRNAIQNAIHWPFLNDGPAFMAPGRRYGRSMNNFTADYSFDMQPHCSTRALWPPLFLLKKQGFKGNNKIMNKGALYWKYSFFNTLKSFNLFHSLMKIYVDFGTLFFIDLLERRLGNKKFIPGLLFIAFICLNDNLLSSERPISALPWSVAKLISSAVSRRELRLMKRSLILTDLKMAPLKVYQST